LTPGTTQIWSQALVSAPCYQLHLNCNLVIWFDHNVL
jgi:hypothetical protein